MTTWKQAYDTGELENTVNITERVRDLSALPPMAFFHTQREAREAAAKIRWPKSSAFRVSLPLGRIRYGIADDHCNVLTQAGYSRLLDEASR